MDGIPEAEAKTATRPLAAGDLIPDFDLAASLGRRVTRGGLRGGRSFVLYFYPKADTSGCTREACEFEQSLGAFAAGGAGGPTIIGVSKDRIRAIDKFAAKHGLTFPLASDMDGALIEACGAWVPKSMYGRSYMGVDRSTFLVGGDGRIVRIWRSVKVPGHVAEVMKAAA